MKNISKMLATPAEDVFAQIMGIAPVGVFLCDQKGECIYANRFWCEITGLTEEESHGNGWATAIHPEEKNNVVEAWQSFVAGAGSFRQTFRFLRPNLAETWVRATATIVRDPSGKITGFIGCLMDISSLKLKEKLVAHSKSEAEVQSDINLMITDTMPNVLYVFSFRTNRFIYVNSHCEKIWGYTPQELFQVDMRAPKFIHNEDLANIASAMENTFQLKDRQTEEMEYRLRHKNGGWIWCRDRITIFKRDEQQQPIEILGVSEDITLRKEALLALEAERTRSIHSAKMASLGEMAGGIAHEINNPLSIITGKAYQIKQKIGMGKFDEREVNQLVDKIEETAFRISKIIRGLRTFSNGGDQDPFVQTPIVAIVEDTLELCRQRFKSHGILLHVNISPDLRVNCRSVQISQVLLNLLNNAHDAVELLTAPWIEISAQKTGGHIEIRITDSGNGIPAKIREKIMQPFFTTKTSQKGTGLGLSISKGIIESHHGELYLDQTSSHTCFVIRLPVTVNPSDVKAA